MKTIFVKNQEFNPLPEPVCAAIGNFDGVHLGHQKLFDECKRHNLKSAVLTFYPHPSVFLKKIKNYTLVTPIEHKIEIIESMGIDYLIIIEFNDEFANMDKDEFIKKIKMLGIKSIVCGYDFTFGKYALGDKDDLAKEFDLYVVEKYIYDNVRVSTTYTRELLQSGNVYEASRMLGREYSIKGEVIKGLGYGKELGYPTANIDYTNYFLPMTGVYLAKVKIANKIYNGMANIGHNPTVSFRDKPSLEVHIFDFDKDIYGLNIEIFFIERIRNESKFQNLDMLKKQLEKDKNECLKLLEKKE